ncbi:BnaCnng06350D [Brassica napus]|uniref:(rape) hypothetical protein n=1 Tax=Brassica napus TaxID=3708 RepID=A0A078GU92_BRANA|nr:unnamed protein product [Brassica napus]CDY28749.1 BnaCnng06350D [Brassica napus]
MGLVSYYIYKYTFYSSIELVMEKVILIHYELFENTSNALSNFFKFVPKFAVVGMSLGAYPVYVNASNNTSRLSGAWFR